VRHKGLQKENECAKLAIVLRIAGSPLFYIQVGLQANFHQVVKILIDYACANMLTT
jgi:hypothetical protein